MWKTTAITLLALTTLTVQSHAGHRDKSSNIPAVAGGILAGVVLSEIINDSTDVRVQFASGCPSSRYNYSRGGSRYRDGWSRYDSGYRNYSYGSRGYRYDSRHHYNDRHHRGHYVYQKRKVWVPGHWDYRVDRYGCKRKIWVPGCHEWRRVKVWVSGHSRGRGYY